VFIDIFINGQHLHRFSSEFVGFYDDTHMREFPSLEAKAEYREILGRFFIQTVQRKLDQQHIVNTQLFLVFPSLMNSKKLGGYALDGRNKIVKN
jgi:hypothetical protein